MRAAKIYRKWPYFLKIRSAYLDSCTLLSTSCRWRHPVAKQSNKLMLTALDLQLNLWHHVEKFYCIESQLGLKVDPSGQILVGGISYPLLLFPFRLKFWKDVAVVEEN